VFSGVRNYTNENAMFDYYDLKRAYDFVTVLGARSIN